ncbi:translation initiation factor IF-2-like [Ursus arctos]|uniref:translation initiation factor IF-2-like n=1 Tax=Ursus arctos TaxID=9644 RepID=UPI001CF920FC|nr:translation initiation factor IF-2-like [Ursus arctos]
MSQAETATCLHLPGTTQGAGTEAEARDCSTVPEAGREPAELGEEPPRPGAEHAAPACSARVHPAQRGGDRAEAVAPGRCLGPDPLHVSPARSHVHRLSPVRRPDVLRINKMKLRATGGQIAPGPPNPHPRQNDLPTTAVSRRSPSARPEPAGQVAALARPRPPAPPHRPGGALPQSLIKKVAKLTLPKVVVACAPLSLPAMYSLKHD